MNRELLDRACERAILALTLLVLVAGPLAFGAVDTLPFLVLQGFTAAIILLWAARLWLNPEPQFLWPPICWAVLAFAAYAVVRYLTADIEYVARQELLRVLTYFFLFFAIVNNLHGKEHTRIIVFVLISLAMLISFYAIYQFVANSDQVWHVLKPYPHRGSGTYICPNHLAGFLEMLVPLGLAYTLAGRLEPLARVFLTYATLVIFAGIAVTVSRGGWISTALASILLFAILSTHRTHRLPALVLLICILGGCLILVPKSNFFRKRGAQLFQQGRLDDDARFSLWRPAVQIWRDHPWWGAGPGHFDYRFRNYRPESIQLQPDRAHNDFLNTLADWGLLGTALVVAAWTLLARGVIKTWPFVRGAFRELGESKRSNKFALVLGASCGLVAILIHSTVDFNMHIPANAILAISLMALLSSHLRFSTDKYWLKVRPWMKVLATVVFLIGLTYVATQGLRQASELVWLNRASQAPNNSPEMVRLLTRAWEIEPRNPDTPYRIGEALRIQSQEGGRHYLGTEADNYEDLANRAFVWFARSAKLNPWNGYSFLRQGWCLDWLDKKKESQPYFAKAEQLDPNGYYTVANIGRHYFELGDYAAAKEWFVRSRRLEWSDNPIAANYLGLIDLRLSEAATNEMRAHLLSPAQ
jgi:O-antigen ligase